VIAPNMLNIFFCLF